MTVKATLVSPEPLRHIVHNLRPRDRAEIFAMRWNDDEDQMVTDVCAVAGDLWRIWWVNDEPAAVNGVVPVRPGVAIAGAFGTNRWKSVVRPMTRWSLEFVIPALKNAGFHRGEAYVLAANKDSRRWIEMLGGEIEAVLKGYGRGREDFLLYVWDLTREGDQDHVFRRQRAGELRPSNDAGYG